MVEDDQLSCRASQRSSRELIQSAAIDGLVNQPFCLALPGEIRPDEFCLAAVSANRAHHLVPRRPSRPLTIPPAHARANSRQAALPIPDVPPVTSATWPFISRTSLRSRYEPAFPVFSMRPNMLPPTLSCCHVPA